MPGDWVAVQKKTFTKWFNNHLRKKGYPVITDLKTDFSDGIMLMRICNALYNVKMPRKYNKKPRMTPHKLDNLNQAMKMLEVKAEVKTNFLKNTHLLDGDEKMIMGMLWSIILHYAINGISVDDLTAKEGLLLWVQKKTAGYAGVDPPKVRNFHRDWTSGLAFNALIHKHHPELLDYDALDHKDQEGNLTKALDLAEQLGIPRLMDVEDLMVSKPDERSVMTYVAEFFHAFASSDVREQALRRANKFLAFARAIEERVNEYERRANALLEWTDESSQFMDVKDFGSTIQEAQDVLDYLKSYVVSDISVHKGELFDVLGLLAEIQTELQVNGRPPYQPPQGLTPDDLRAALTALDKRVSVYHTAATAHRFTFVTKIESGLSEEQLTEFKTSFDHFDANKNNVLNAVEFKAVCMVNNVPFRDEDAFLEVFAKASDSPDGVTFEGYIAFMSDLAADKDTADQVASSFAALAGANAKYISDEQLNSFAPEDADYIRRNATKTDEGYDFAGLVNRSYE